MIQLLRRREQRFPGVGLLGGTPKNVVRGRFGYCYDHVRSVWFADIPVSVAQTYAQFSLLSFPRLSMVHNRCPLTLFGPVPF